MVVLLVPIIKLFARKLVNCGQFWNIKEQQKHITKSGLSVDLKLAIIHGHNLYNTPSNPDVTALCKMNCDKKGYTQNKILTQIAHF